MNPAGDIAKHWLDRTIRDYPANAQPFLAAELDPFRNPVGHTLRENLGILVRECLGAMDRQALAEAMDKIMQLRAVQDLPPAKALDFIFDLRTIAGESGNVLPDDMVDRVDQLALLAFDKYMEFRERIFDLRLKELRIRLQSLSMEESQR